METTQPDPLTAFLRGCRTAFVGAWHPQALLNAADTGFESLVVAITRSTPMVTELSWLIRNDPGRLRSARNRLVVISTWRPALTSDDLEAANMHLQMMELA